MKKTLKQLESERDAINAEINQLREKEVVDVQWPNARKLVGTRLVYRDNHFGGERKKKDCWNVYKRVLDFIEGSFIVESFEVNSYGTTEHKFDSVPLYAWRQSDPLESFPGCEICSAREYQKAMDEFMLETGSQSKLRKNLLKKT